jgi:hypothetical protein
MSSEDPVEKRDWWLPFSTTSYGGTARYALAPICDGPEDVVEKVSDTDNFSTRSWPNTRRPHRVRPERGPPRFI